MSDTPPPWWPSHVLDALEALTLSTHTELDLSTPCITAPESFSQTSRTILDYIAPIQWRIDETSLLGLSIVDNPQSGAYTLNQVIVALATLQSSVQDLSRAYINHANTVLGPGSGGALDNNLTNFLSGSAFLPGRALPTEAAAPVEEPAGDGKKKRKRAKHDPNAPKRALTPYFLFMQTARAQIAKELGDNAKPKEVADEGTRRWGTMPPEDKHVSCTHCPGLNQSDIYCRSGKRLTRRILPPIVSAWPPTKPVNQSLIKTRQCVWSRLGKHLLRLKWMLLQVAPSTKTRMRMRLSQSRLLNHQSRLSAESLTSLLLLLFPWRSPSPLRAQRRARKLRPKLLLLHPPQLQHP